MKARPLRILHAVESYFPSVGGMQEVVRRLSELLTARGHELTVACKHEDNRKELRLNGVKIEPFRLSGNLVEGIMGDFEEQERYRNLLRSDFDIVTLFAAQQWSCDLGLSILPSIRAKKFFVPTGFSGLYRPEYATYFQSMRHWMREFDLSIFLSEDYRDINFAVQNQITRRALIPNGASYEEFTRSGPGDLRTRLGIPNDAFLILHVGSHTALKGHAEMLRIFEQADLPNSVLLLIGNRFRGGCGDRCHRSADFFNAAALNKKMRKRVVMADLDRPTTVQAYHAADLFFFPSNIECSPIVLFECAASRTPFLATDVGNSKEIVKWTQGGRILETRKDRFLFSFANESNAIQSLESMRRNPELRAQLAAKAHQVWLERFTWEKIAGQFEEAYYNQPEQDLGQKKR